MLKEVLEAALTWEQREAGFYLEEDEDFLYLFDQNGNQQAVFSSKGATVKAIRGKASELMTEAKYEP